MGLRHPSREAANADRDLSPTRDAAGSGSLRHFTRMPDQPDLANQPSAAVLLERHFALADEAATTAFGERFAHAIDSVRSEARGTDHRAFNGLQVQLHGDLGAGKTTLVRAT